MIYVIYPSEVCQDGDVSYFESRPKMFWKGRFLDICGDGFWNDDYGAKLFCKKLGYPSGGIKVYLSSTSQPMVDALRVMQCPSRSSSLLECSGSYVVQPKRDCTGGGRNRHYKIHCSGAFVAREASCKASGRDVSTLLQRC